MKIASPFPAKLVDLISANAATVSPLDGRYQKQVAPLGNYLSEAALNRNRILVEMEWLIFLSDNHVFTELPALNDEEIAYLRASVSNFDESSINRIAEIERITRHDVKAVEYYLKEYLEDSPKALGSHTIIPRYVEAVHIFCTSEDVNNLAYALGIREAILKIWLPAYNTLIQQLSQLAIDTAGIPMLARTHGQPATPVTLGKEIAVFVERLKRQANFIQDTEYRGKFNGATGTWAAHKVALPNINWPEFTSNFISTLGLKPNLYTTQIENHDWQAELYAHISHACSILHNLSTDFWTYISLGYFQQNLQQQGSTGSSTMPHKINPIRFENAESNLELSLALLANLQVTLTTSRLQRDLTDSSTQRNIGVALGHSLLALQNLSKGIDGLSANEHIMRNELEHNWEILGEAIQQTMRVAGLCGVPGMEEPYEKLKELTRGRRVDSDVLKDFIQSLGLPAEYENRLLALTPLNYIGYALQLGRQEL